MVANTSLQLTSDAVTVCGEIGANLNVSEQVLGRWSLGSCRGAIPCEVAGSFGSLLRALLIAREQARILASSAMVCIGGGQRGRGECNIWYDMRTRVMRT